MLLPRYCSLLCGYHFRLFSLLCGSLFRRLRFPPAPSVASFMVSFYSVSVGDLPPHIICYSVGRSILCCNAMFMFCFSVVCNVLSYVFERAECIPFLQFVRVTCFPFSYFARATSFLHVAALVRATSFLHVAALVMWLHWYELMSQFTISGNAWHIF